MSELGRSASSQSRFWFALAATVAVSCALRLAFRIDYAEEVDSIRFLLALDDFDVSVHHPHFPGYPIFVVWGRAFYALGGGAVSALATLCALSGALLVVPVALFVRTTAGERAALWVLPLVTLNPLLWLFSEKLLSDAPGLLFLFSSLAVLIVALRRPNDRLWLTAAFVLLGLTMGVRLSYFPFVLSAYGLVIWRRRAWAIPVLAGTVGVALWAIPMLVDTGLAAMLETAQMQGGGHFGRWGGTVTTRPDLPERATMLMWELVAQGLGTWWTDRSARYMIPTVGLAAVLAAAFATRRAPARSAQEAEHGEPLVFWAALVVPYAVWVFLGQNITVKVRHVLPLVTLEMVFLALALGRMRRGAAATRAAAWLGAGAMLAGWAASGWALVSEHQRTPSNGVLLARGAQQICTTLPGEAPMVVYTASLQRHLERHAPCTQVVVLRRAQQVDRDLLKREVAAHVYVTSDIGFLQRLDLEPVLAFERSPYIQNTRRRLTLFRVAKHDNAPHSIAGIQP